MALTSAFILSTVMVSATSSRTISLSAMRVDQRDKAYPWANVSLKCDELGQRGVITHHLRGYRIKRFQVAKMRWPKRFLAWNNKGRFARKQVSRGFHQWIARNGRYGPGAPANNSTDNRQRPKLQKSYRAGCLYFLLYDYRPKGRLWVCFPDYCACRILPGFAVMRFERGNLV